MPNEDLLSEKLLQPMVQLSYAAAMDLVQARLRLINADLTEQCHRQVIRLPHQDAGQRHQKTQKERAGSLF